MQTFCRLDEQGKELMRAAVRRMELSALWYHRVLKPARTIADLAGEAEAQTPHLTEALQHRPRVWCRTEHDWMRYNQPTVLQIGPHNFMVEPWRDYSGA